ncbi:Kae1-like domain-containing protein [Halanaerobaculum tunisiense]
MILGIDTSNYTTSVALMKQTGRLVTQARELLKVAEGQRGLRQSKAVFQHINQLPAVIKKVLEKTDQELTKVVVSDRPRANKDSYLPVFRVGESQAKTLANTLNIPLVKVSHQEGHLQAGVWSSSLEAQEFLAVHISGGTTELLKVTSVPEEIGFEVATLGGSEDLHAGQFVDRVGVELGLSFPAGPDLEELAQEGKAGAVEVPTAVQDYQISFSGPASAAMRLIEQGKKKANIALAVQQAIADSLQEVLKNAIQGEELKDVLIVGGVAANQYIRDRLHNRLQAEANLYFADPQWSSDNAIGTTALGIKN